jgi:putrescine transport system ATP-binding protein
VMNAGRIVQTGTPHELYERPATRFVADFVGIANIIDVKDGHWLAIRPEKIALSTERPATDQAIAGDIVDIAYEGDRSLYRIAVKDGPVMRVSRTNATRAHDHAFRRGQHVWMGWNNDAGQVLTE